MKVDNMTLHVYRHSSSRAPVSRLPAGSQAMLPSFPADQAVPGAHIKLFLPSLPTEQRPSCRVMLNIGVTQCCMVTMWWIRNIHEEEALWLCKTPSPVLLSYNNTAQICIVCLLLVTSCFCKHSIKRHPTTHICARCPQYQQQSWRTLLKKVGQSGVR